MKKFILNEKQKVALVLVLIIIIQLVFRFYIGFKKNYFHIDEIYSYGLMNYKITNITDNEDFLNTWHSKDYYLDYLEVNSNEVWNLSPVYENQKNDVHPPFYYLLLRTASSFFLDNFTKWSGLLLNIIIFAMSSILVYKTSKCLFKNSLLSILVCILNGFSLISLESFAYIRMYELCNLFVLAISYIHIKIWRKPNLKWYNLLSIIAVLLLGGLTHYYFFIYVVILYLIYSVKNLKKKQYSNFIKYQLAIIISAVIYLFIFPYSIGHVLGSNNIFHETATTTIFVRVFQYLYLIHSKYFNNLLLLFIIIIGFICYKKKFKKLKSNSQINLLIIPILIYLFIVIISSPYIEMRYIIPIYSVSFILVFYIAKKYLFEHLGNKQSVFLLILLVTTFSYCAISNSDSVEYTYPEYTNVVSQVEDNNLPIVYYFNTNKNRFLEDLYLFTLTDKSIILDANNRF